MSSRSIIPFSLCDGFALCRNRPVLFCSPVGDNGREFTRYVAEPTYYDEKQEIGFGPINATIHREELESGVIHFSGKLVNTGDVPVRLARFHYLDGILSEDADFLSLTEQHDGTHQFGKSDSIEAHRPYLEKLWASMRVNWPRFHDPIHEQPDWALSEDVGILLSGHTSSGCVIGFTGPGTAFGEIGYGTCRRDGVPFFAAVKLDGVILEPGQSRELERFAIIGGDWQDGMKTWARYCSESLGSRPATHALKGYCSWYQMHSHILPEHIIKAADEFVKWPSVGPKTVQIDDGYQRYPGDWRPNKRFLDIWEGLPGRIADTGALPGLWLAPTAIHAHHDIVKDHPDWIQHGENMLPLISFSNWGWCNETFELDPEMFNPLTYFLEPDRPECREMMKDIIRDAVAQGWRYLKLDFVYALSTERVPYDPHKTRFESLRGLYKLFREAAGDETLICACTGGLHRFALGYVDTARIGGDTGARFDSLRENMLGAVIQQCVNGLWWQCDPDVYYMRRENTCLTREESWLLTGTVGLLGGVFMTSDFISQWDDADAENVCALWNEVDRGIPNTWVLLKSGTTIDALISIEPDGKIRMGIYNWSDSPFTIAVPWSSLPKEYRPVDLSRIKPFLFDEVLSVDEERISIADQPPHSLRIVTW